MHKHSLVSGGLFLLLAAVAVLVYVPGLQGSFLFDDFANLPALGATGPVRDVPSFLRYITSGTADPTGRPIALLSFLLDARNWPASPFPFKRTNLLLHLLNGLLLLGLLSRLGRTMTSAEPASKFRADMAAVLGAGFWLLHPLFVSTTLYVVQREAMLPVAFVLFGLLAWLQGRTRLMQGYWLTGTIWCLVGLVGGTLLATLSKANGVLLPLFALLIEQILLQPALPNPHIPTDKAHRAKRCYLLIRVCLLWLPAGVILGWLLYQGIPDILAGHTHGRPWTVGQRLLTEARIIADYLRLLWAPHPYTSGLFNDQIAVSHSLIEPRSTLFAILFVLGLLVLGLGLRRRVPAWSLALLFYLAGQLIESTVLPLELYFEHRNYMPALLMFWPLGLWISGAHQSPQARNFPLHRIRVIPRALLAITLLAVLALTTHARSDLWGNTREQALLWVQINPHSPRAQANAAQSLVDSGYPGLAIPRLRQALSNSPTEVQLALNLFGAECRLGKVSAATFRATEQALRSTSDPGTLLAHWFGRAIDGANGPVCPQADFPHIERLLAAFGQNKMLMAKANRRQDLAYLQGSAALAQGNAKQALALFDRALDQQVRVEAALQQAALLGSTGHPKLGLEHLAHYDKVMAADIKSGQAYRPPFGMARLHAWVLHRQGYWDHELHRLRATLQEDARNKQVTSG